MQQTFERFIQAVRGADIRVSVSEALEAHAAMALLGFEDRQRLKDGLGAVLAKSAAEQRRFEQCFERFFAPVPPAAAPVTEADADADPEAGPAPAAEAGPPAEGLARVLLERDTLALQQAVQRAAAGADIAAMRMVSQRGVFMQRIMRQLGTTELNARIEALAQGGRREEAAALRAGRSWMLNELKAYMRRQVELYTGAAGKSLREAALRERPLAQIDPADHARLRELVQQLARRLANVHARRALRANRGVLDLRRTLRHNMGHGGDIATLHWRRSRIDRPRVVAICDVSRSVADYSQFLLLFLYSLSDALSRLRSFTFCGDVAEVTDIFARQPMAEALPAAQAAAPIGSTDYGRLWQTLVERHLDAFTPRTTVLILGDARNNHLDPGAGALKLLRQRSRELIWLNPEPELDWGTGDSEMDRYRPFCELVRQAGTLAQLEQALDEMLKRSLRAA